MNNRQKQIHTIDIIFPLIFIVFFWILCSLLGSFGRTYLSENNGWLKQNYTVRTAAAYVQEKIREYSSSSQVEVLTENNRTVLALYEPENTGYVTYIYLYKGKLRELFTKKERGIEWESGQELVSADTFSVIKQKEDLLRIYLSGSGQEELVYARIYGEDER